MAKYCGKCGAKLNESTGMCPNCTSKSATYKKEVSSTKKKYKSSPRYILTIVILLGIVIANAYFDIVDIPVINDIITRPRSEILDEYVYNDSIIGTFTESKAVDEASALRVANEITEVYSLKEDGRELVANDVRKSADTVYYRYSQSYQGIPIYSSDIIVMADGNGVVTGASVSVPKVDLAELSVTPVVTAQEIFTSIKEEFNTEQVAILTLLSSDQLVIYTHANTDQAFLAYKLPAQINGIDYDIIVDAITGDILTSNSTVYQYNAGNNTEILSANGDVLCDKTYFLDQNGTRYEQGEIDKETGYRLWLDAEGNEYFISSKVRNAQIYTSEMVEAGTMDGGLRYELYTQESADNLIFDVDQKPETAQLQDLSDQFIRFLDIYLNRNGYDGNGGKVYIVYDDGFNWGIESYSIGNKQHEDTVIKFGKNKTIDRAFADTFAHEYTHSMEKTISNMDYSGESGALMEAISDIFGELFEDYYNDGLLNNNCNWKSEYTEFASGCRNMKDPSDDGSIFAKYAAAYRDKNWVDGDGKYTNSTVISHMAYLLVTGEGEGVLSTEDLLHLIYETLYLIPQDCSFITFKHKLEDAAELLNFSDAQKQHMTNCLTETGLEQSVYHPNTKLTVWDKQLQKYDNYIIVIEGQQNNGKTVKKSISVETESSVKLQLKKGSYRITIHDNAENGNATVYCKDIVISNKSKYDCLEFFTDYGEMNSVISFEQTTNSTGNTTNNLYQSGGIVFDKEYVYVSAYSQLMGEGGIYRINLLDGRIEKKYEPQLAYLNIFDGYIYGAKGYVANTIGDNIIRINLGTGISETVFEATLPNKHKNMGRPYHYVDSIFIVNGYMFFSTHNGYIASISKSGRYSHTRYVMDLANQMFYQKISETECISEGVPRDIFSFYEDYIYIYDDIAGGYLKRIPLKSVMNSPQIETLAAYRCSWIDHHLLIGNNGFYALHYDVVDKYSYRAYPFSGFENIDTYEYPGTTIIDFNDNSESIALEQLEGEKFYIGRNLFCVDSRDNNLYMYENMNLENPKYILSMRDGNFSNCIGLGVHDEKLYCITGKDIINGTLNIISASGDIHSISLYQ